ncbi:MAG: hypothetical protein AAGA35_00030 [Patescibacteria group bacterium]
MKTTTTLSISILVVAIVAFIGAQWYVQNNLAEAQDTVVAQIEAQQAALVELAELTDQNGADDVVRSIIRDCSASDRSRFDLLLGSLNDTLSQTELVELRGLFDKCGDFFAARKAVMVSRFSAQVENYTATVGLLGELSAQADVTVFQVPEWQALAGAEEEKSRLFNDLVRLQAEIIDALLAGGTAGSSELQVLLNEVAQTQDSLSVLGITIDEQRQTLSDS